MCDDPVEQLRADSAASVLGKDADDDGAALGRQNMLETPHYCTVVRVDPPSEPVNGPLGSALACQPFTAERVEAAESSWFSA